MPKNTSQDLPTISLQEIMRGGAMKAPDKKYGVPERNLLNPNKPKSQRKPRKSNKKAMEEMNMVLQEQVHAPLLASQPVDIPNVDIEGGKINMKKVARVYRKHVRPAVTKAVKAAEKPLKIAAKTALVPVLINSGVPAPVASHLATAAVDASTEVLKSGLNQSGVTKGAGIKIPNFSVKVESVKTPVFVGGAINIDAGMVSPMKRKEEAAILPVQMVSNNQASFAAARMTLSNGSNQPNESPYRTDALPVQMQSNPQFTNMNVGRGLYMGGSGLYLSGRTGRGLY
jgi:hypothetical protein